MGIGQSDLNLSIPTLKKIQKESSINFISSNVKTKKGDYPFPRYSIIDSNGVKFGVLSVSTDRHVRNKDVIIQDPSKAIVELMPILKDQGANFIILLTQMGVDPTLKLLSALPSELKIDLVITADLFYSSSKVYWLKNGVTLLANQDFAGAYIGKLEINYDTLPISVFASPTQIKINEERIKQLEAQLTTRKDNITFIKQELNNLKTNEQKEVPEGASLYDGGLIGLDNSFDTVETINPDKFKIFRK